VASQQWADDDQLMAALAEALQAERNVPRDFIEPARPLSPGTASTLSWPL
jgi:hypothetical protein